MAGYDGSLKFDTEISEKGFNSGITKLGSLAKGGLSVLAGAIGTVTAALGAGAVAGLKYNASIETYQTSFEVMTGSAEKAAEVIDRLKKVGAETPFELPELADTTQLLMNYGLTADEAMDKMMMLGDISQGSADKMSRIAMAYGQMSSAGKVQLEDIKQMIEAGFNPLQEISESTGESMASLYDRISEGTLSVDEITASMQRATSEGGKYYQSMQKQSQAFDGMISTLKDNARQLIGEVVQPISDSMVNTLLPAAIDAIDQMSNAFQTQGAEGLIQAGSQILVNLLTGIAQGLPGALPKILDFIQGIGEQLAAAAPIMVQKGFELLSKLAEGIVTAFPILIEKVPTIISTFANIINDNFPTILAKGAELLGQLALGLIQAIPTLVSHIPQIIQAIIDALMAFQWVNLGRNIIKGLGDGIGAMKDFVKQKGKDILNAIKGAIQNLPSTLLNIGKSAVSDLGGAIRSGVGTIKSAASGLVSGIVNTISSIPGKMLSIGKNIVRGLWNGISDMTGWVLDKIKGFGDSVLGGIKSFFGIKSPSRLMRDEVGKYLAQGVGVGFAENVPTDDMTNEMKRSVQTLKTASIKITTAPVTGTFALAGGGTYRYDNEISGLRKAILKVAKLSNRPVVATFNIDGKRIAKVIAKPMTEEQERLERLNSRKRGIKK